MPDSVYYRNAALRAQLKDLIGWADPIPSSLREGVAPGRANVTGRATARSYDVLVTLNEINNRHGTGPLLKRLVKGRDDILCVRSRDDWGEHDLAGWNARIAQPSDHRPDWYRNVLQVLGGTEIRNVVCVPFLQDELKTAIAIHGAFGARLCLYIMDDQNVSAQGIPDDLMEEALARSCLRFVTHPELRTAYQAKYRVPFHLLPAIVPAELVPAEPGAMPAPGPPLRAALLGSFWDQAWFDRLCGSLEGSGFDVDWYGNNRSPWLTFAPEALRRANITPKGVAPECDLAAQLRRYPFVIVPVGALDARDSNNGVASLSLPGRILFAAATAAAPILVVGSGNTCGSRFVAHFDIGETVPYEAGALRAAMYRLASPEAQVRFRRNAASIAHLFSDRGMPEWLLRSIGAGQPADARFEDAFAGYPH